MIKTLLSPKTSGNIKAIASKSEVHRLLIAAALSDKTTEIICEKTNADITATAQCLKALGADITYNDSVFTVTPIKEIPDEPVLPCNESGSTLRFLLPLVCFYGKGGIFEAKGRLSSRPLSPLKEELERYGAEILTEEGFIKITGKTSGTDFTIPGNVSSQFISGLLFMLTKTGGSINITGKTESLPYIEMTIDALKLFGCEISFSGGKITVEKTSPLISPGKAESGGDWSNAAFFITAGVIGKEKITVSGLDINSRQGDKKITDILKSFGAKIEASDSSVTAYPSELHAFSFDASDIPDLVPVLSVAAANAKGVTRITGCKRLRIKESDRIEAVRRLITELGGKITVENDDIIITGSPLSGGVTDSENDHRIAMSAAVAAFSCDKEITVNGAEAINKSYPSFWDEIK